MVQVYKEGPRHDWEEVLRSVGSLADREGLREVLFLELGPRLVLQGLAPPPPSPRGEWAGSLQQRTYEFDESGVAQLLDERYTHRGKGTDRVRGVEGFYENAFRALGRQIDHDRPTHVFFFEQNGAFVVRLLRPAPGSVAHEVREYTRDEITAMAERTMRERGPR